MIHSGYCFHNRTGVVQNKSSLLLKIISLNTQSDNQNNYLQSKFNQKLLIKDILKIKQEGLSFEDLESSN